jgi:hypothetical protein
MGDQGAIDITNLSQIPVGAVASVDTPTVSGVKCIRVRPPSWREVIVGLLDQMRGTRPRMAVITWDGAAFQFREVHPPQRITVD